ncbi:MAG: sulfatase-like hydrolase/transferase [Erythrobacter sp.]|nr:sulfatase-like hydrolase/transferase [Erythrobacter sp.]
MDKRLKSFCAAALAAVATAGVLLPPAAPALAQDRAGAERAAPAPAPRTDGPPNIVLIMADDMGVEAINAYGGQYATPNIDALSRQGMRLDQAFATPLCTPSRTRLMTGRENASNYRAFGYLDPAETTFAQVLQGAGYTTAIAGKWQLAGNGFDGRQGMMPLDAGFDEAMLWQVASGPARGSRYWGPTFWINGRTVMNEEGFGPDLTTQFARDFIRRNRERPFLLYYPIVLPHSPFVPTPMSMDAQGAQARFAGMVSYLDTLVGQVLAELHAQGLDDNTLVIFTGDNGTNRQIVSYRDGHEVQGGKGTPTLNGTHVPMIVRWPGRVAPGSSSAALFDFMDMLPTLADVAGVSIDGVTHDGVSQLPVITGQSTGVRDTIYMHYAPAWMFEPTRFVFNSQYKLYADGRFVALDMVSGQETDVANPTGEAARTLARFRTIMARDVTPLDQTRFPMCAGNQSNRPGVAAEIAGCPELREMQGNE